MTRLDDKLARIRAGRYTPSDFIIADAKDGDMAFGCATPGAGADGRMKPLSAYRDDMQRVIASGLADILLMSVSSAEVMAERDAFAGSDVTPAVRLNDTTDIWQARGGAYPGARALPFRTARLDRARDVAGLGLFSVTFYNDLAHDHAMLEAYAQFRDEAGAAGMAHFLEIFNPQVPVVVNGDFASYNNDMIVRCLAGVARRDRPLFLKAAYNGPRATEEIAGYDPENLVFGILGGGAGTTRDCLELLVQAERYGARVALFGRKIYRSEDSVLMLGAMRRVLEERLPSAEGVRAYHADLQAAGKAPFRALDDDLALTEEVLRAAAP
ncbi:hypothetical protein [Pseudoponticoccus marisrubri]|uniref:Aldolase n=1 Tax=Pseudoponticoccus marisrubri TaxID=1685382 RepID=A0A0W7WDY6_9RHOB|nr:hypothetical protein [Pseudoponticoccus marisrubri]KUF08860.1 hypothetical protein AVJ23_20445 [Pseudoponticoccus marisrubri]